ncbi:hypothetical protein MRX96_017049 [Rhipicephalus microplus]
MCCDERMEEEGSHAAPSKAIAAEIEKAADSGEGWKQGENGAQSTSGVGRTVEDTVATESGAEGVSGDGKDDRHVACKGSQEDHKSSLKDKSAPGTSNAVRRSGGTRNETRGRMVPMSSRPRTTSASTAQLSKESPSRCQKKTRRNTRNLSFPADRNRCLSRRSNKARRLDEVYGTPSLQSTVVDCQAVDPLSYALGFSNHRPMVVSFELNDRVSYCHPWRVDNRLLNNETARASLRNHLTASIGNHSWEALK